MCIETNQKAPTENSLYAVSYTHLFSRVPEEEAIFSNWNTSWWKLKDEALTKMEERGIYQGKEFHYCNGPALSKI